MALTHAGVNHRQKHNLPNASKPYLIVTTVPVALYATGTYRLTTLCMNEASNRLTPEESLQLIESMINTAKNRFVENGHMYLVWGWAVFVCSIAQFVLLHFVHYEKHYMVWLAAIPVTAYMIYYIRGKKKRLAVVTYADSLVRYVWLTFGVVIFLISWLIGIAMGGGYFIYIAPLTLSLYGMPIFLSGVILKFRPLVWGGISCWVLCVISVFITSFDYRFLLIPVSMLTAWIIPGYLLRSRHKRAMSL